MNFNQTNQVSASAQWVSFNLSHPLIYNSRYRLEIEHGSMVSEEFEFVTPGCSGIPNQEHTACTQTITKAPSTGTKPLFVHNT